MSSETQLVLNKNQKEKLESILNKLTVNSAIMAELIKKYALESKSDDNSK